MTSTQTPPSHLRGAINVRGGKRDDFSFPPRLTTTLAATTSFFAKRNPFKPFLHATPLNV